MEYSKNKVAFLDTETFNDEGQLHVSLYSKPTDSHSYLDFSSCHPSHNKTAIPYSQFLRLRRNCTNWTDFATHAIKLVQYLSMRGYPEELVLPALHRANKLTHTETLTLRENIETNKNKLFCIIDYNPSNPPIKDWITTLWPILYRSSGTRSLADMQIVYGSRKPKSLQDILVKSDVTKRAKIRHLAPRCNRFLRCKHCPRMIKSGKVYSHSTGRKYQIPAKMSCNSSNVIYMLECIKCGIQYVGQTKNKILTRINQHYSTIRTKAETPVSRHFNSECGSDYPFKIYILQHIRANDPDDVAFLRNKWEMYWIARLHTIVPHGLNIQD